MRRRTNLALNHYAVGSRPADREVARPRETRLLSTAFPMSALPRIATTERTSQHVSNVPEAEMKLASEMSNTLEIMTGDEPIFVRFPLKLFTIIGVGDGDHRLRTIRN
jgi:hypothetical protein